MDPIPIWRSLMWVAALTAVNALFAVARVAVDELNEARLEKQASEGDVRASHALKMLDRVPGLLATIETITTFSGLLAAANAAENLTLPLATALYHIPLINRISAPYLNDGARVLVVLLLTCFLLVLGAMAPRRIAARYMAEPSYPLVRLASAASTFLKPLVRLMAGCSNALLRLFGIDPNQNDEHVTEEEILAMVDIGEEKGSIEKNEKEMIENIFEFNNMTAEDCMTHRTDVTAIWIGDSDEEIVEIIEQTGLSRFPVYDDDIDDILGVLTTRDYLLNARREHPKPILELVRPAFFVPESARTDLLFREMQTRKTHMAIVVDEYGGMSGIITMEDLLEEIVGNIYDEFDPLAEQDIIPLPDGRFRVAGSADLHALSEAMGVELPLGEEYDTLGGMVFSQLTTIPIDGSHPEILSHGLKIRVEEIADRRIEWATVERIPDPEPAESEPTQ